MEQLSHLKPGDVLGEVDLASYIGAMAKGVAEAQKALDDNTIGLLGQFSQPIGALAGKSLLALGLSPAFYHFRSATISASVSMSIRVRQEIDVSVHVGIGGSQSSTATAASGFKETTSAHDAVTFSDNFVAHTKSAQESSAIEAIDAYSENNSATSTHFVLAERMAVAASDKTELTGSALVLYNAQADLYAVPPAGLDWAVIWLAKASAGEQYEIKANQPLPTTSGTSPADLATAIKGQVKTAYILSATAGGADDLREVLFATNSHMVKPVGTRDYPARLRALARIIIAAQLGPVTVSGHTDGVGPPAYNQRLSELRANSVRDVLQTHLVSVTSATGLGESGAADNAEVPAQRWARVGLKPFPGCLIYIEDDPGVLNSQIMPASGSETSNGLVVASHYDLNGTAITNRLAVASAAELVQRFTAADKVEASQSGELVYLTYSQSSNKKVAKVQVYAAQSSSQETEQSSNIGASQDSAAETALTQAAGTEVNRASAVVASMDVRFSRMFDVSMAGNMSIAAELVSIPPPPEFLQFIKDHLGD